MSPIMGFLSVTVDPVSTSGPEVIRTGLDWIDYLAIMLPCWLLLQLQQKDNIWKHPNAIYQWYILSHMQQLQQQLIVWLSLLLILLQ